METLDTLYVFASHHHILTEDLCQCQFTSAILSNRANRSLRIFTNCWADVLLANSVKPLYDERVTQNTETEIV